MRAWFVRRSHKSPWLQAFRLSSSTGSEETVTLDEVVFEAELLTAAAAEDVEVDEAAAGAGVVVGVLVPLS